MCVAAFFVFAPSGRAVAFPLCGEPIARAVVWLV
jgi:hypothetical protein